MYLWSHVIDKLICPACNAEYMGKTDRCLRVRLDEHSSDHNSAMFQHLHIWEVFKFMLSLNNLPECVNKKADVVNFKLHVHETNLNNVTVIAIAYRNKATVFLGVFAN